MTTEIRILKIVTCKSLSGKSDLVYHVGCTDKKEILWRIYGNTGKGFFNKDWISAKDIQKVALKKTVTSVSFHALYGGKSVNTAGFLLAALLIEGLVVVSATKKRCYDGVDSAAFNGEIKALMDSGTDLDPDAKVTVPTAEAKPGKTSTTKGIQKGKPKKNPA